MKAVLLFEFLIFWLMYIQVGVLPVPPKYILPTQIVFKLLITTLFIKSLL